MKTNIDFRIDEKTVVEPKTLKEAFELCNFLDKLGAKMIIGDRYTEYIHWIKGRTCYDVLGGVWVYTQDYIDKGYKFISVNEFLKLHEDVTFNVELKGAITDLNNLTDRLNAIHKNYRSGIIANNTVDAGMAKVTSISGAIGDLVKAKKKLNEI